MDDKLSDVEEALLRVMRSEPSRWWFALDLLEICKEREEGVWIHNGNIYTILRRLVSLGFVEDRRETTEEQNERVASYRGKPDPRGGRPRRYYRVTGKGRKYTQEEPAPGFLLPQLA